MKLSEILGNSIVINCDTLLKAAALMQEFEKRDYMWYSNEKPTVHTDYWDDFTIETCYSLTQKEDKTVWLGYDSVIYYRFMNYTIVNYDDIVFD